MKQEARNGNGLFIVLEGIDGSGKDTHLDLLAEWLESQGREVTKTAEPWKSEEGKKAREIAMHGRQNLSPEEEAAIYLEDRKQHAEQLILPALREGRTVLCGRYYYSTMAYQGALGADPEEIRRQNESAVPIPDVVIMLKIDLETGFSRIHERGKSLEKGYEKKEYLVKVAEILYNITAPNIHHVESSGKIEETRDRIREIIRPLL